MGRADMSLYALWISGICNKRMISSAETNDHHGRATMVLRVNGRDNKEQCEVERTAGNDKLKVKTQIRTKQLSVGR